jgi:hypothetical protein
MFLCGIAIHDHQVGTFAALDGAHLIPNAKRRNVWLVRQYLLSGYVRHEHYIRPVCRYRAVEDNQLIQRNWNSEKGPCDYRIGQDVPSDAMSLAVRLSIRLDQSVAD